MDESEIQNRRLRLAADSAHELTCTPWWRIIKRSRLTNVVAFQVTALLRRLAESEAPRTDG